MKGIFELKPALPKYSEIWDVGYLRAAAPLRSLPLNPSTPGTFCQNCGFFLTFWWFWSWIVAKLASVWWKTHWQHVSQPFLPPESHSRHFSPGMRRNQNLVTCPHVPSLPCPSFLFLLHSSRWILIGNPHALLMWLLRSGLMTRQNLDQTSTYKQVSFNLILYFLVPGSHSRPYLVFKYGQLRERARWIKSCAVIGYPSGQDGAILPAQDYLPRPARKKPYNKSFIDPVCLVKMAGCWPRSFFCAFMDLDWFVSRSINTRKKNLANIQPSWPHTWSITHIYHTDERFSCIRNWRWMLVIRKMYCKFKTVCFYLKVLWNNMVNYSSLGTLRWIKVLELLLIHAIFFERNLWHQIGSFWNKSALERLINN